jgi:hypothetical protein
MPITWNPTKWLDSLIESRMHVAGQAMVGIAKALVPVDTGLLRSTIAYSYAPDTKTGTYNNPFHVPLKIKPHIRPSIEAANMKHNVGVTSRTKLTAIHMNRANEARRHNIGLKQESRVMMTSLSKLNRIRKAWN